MNWNRRTFLINSAAWVASAATLPSLAAAATDGPAEPVLEPITPPKHGPIKVAFLISEQFQMIDFAGPWEVFQDASNPLTSDNAFKVYTVSRSLKPMKASGGLKVTPDYDFASAPIPHVLVIPAQTDNSQPVLDWIRHIAGHADVVMSVCTGAYLLADTGLLNGKRATTHHSAYKMFAVNYPKVNLEKQVRFVDNGKIATSSGLSAGIDLALHVVARYFGVAVADATAAEMEYMGKGWRNPADTGDLFTRIAENRKQPRCPVCDFGPVGKEISYSYNGKMYFFCSDTCKGIFVKSPEKYLPSH